MGSGVPTSRPRPLGGPRHPPGRASRRRDVPGPTGASAAGRLRSPTPGTQGAPVVGRRQAPTRRATPRGRRLGRPAHEPLRQHERAEPTDRPSARAPRFTAVVARTRRAALPLAGRADVPGQARRPTDGGGRHLGAGWRTAPWVATRRAPGNRRPVGRGRPPEVAARRGVEVDCRPPASAARRRLVRHPGAAAAQTSLPLTALGS